MTIDKKQQSTLISNKEQNQLAKLLASRFIQRRDVKAVQSPSGAYKPLHHRWTVKDVNNHVAGKVTYGHYLVDEEGRCRIVAFDLDFDKAFTWTDPNGSVVEVEARDVFGTDHPARSAMNTQMRVLADGIAWVLKRRNPRLVIMTAFSGSKGLHVYGCFPKPTTASAARRVALDVLEEMHFEEHLGKNFFKRERFEELTVEVFPKQERIGVGGFGNLLRLPLGINRKTERAGFFYRHDVPLDVFEPADPIETLQKGSLT